MSNFFDIAFGPAALRQQAEAGSFEAYERMRARVGDQAELGQREREFIAGRDSFYLATVTADGWPYVQHRGGTKGFVKLLTPSSFAIADMSGNRQYVTLGNAATSPRASLFFMDYPGRRRLKLFAEIEIADRDFAMREQLVEPAAMDRVERSMIFHLRGFDWNCPKYITPRWTREELAEMA